MVLYKQCIGIAVCAPNFLQLNKDKTEIVAPIVFMQSSYISLCFFVFV